MSKEARMTGVTPYVLRLSAYYVALGFGEYKPQGNSFDRVVVRELMPWEPRENFTESATITIVEYYQGNHRCRWVEFRVSPAGFGGDPIMKLEGKSQGPVWGKKDPPPENFEPTGLPAGLKLRLVEEVVAADKPAANENDGPSDDPPKVA